MIIHLKQPHAFLATVKVRGSFQVEGAPEVEVFSSSRLYFDNPEISSQLSLCLVGHPQEVEILLEPAEDTPSISCFSSFLSTQEPGTQTFEAVLSPGNTIHP